MTEQNETYSSIFYLRKTIRQLSSEGCRFSFRLVRWPYLLESQDTLFPFPIDPADTHSVGFSFWLPDLIKLRTLKINQSKPRNFIIV